MGKGQGPKMGERAWRGEAQGGRGAGFRMARLTSGGLLAAGLAQAIGWRGSIYLRPRSPSWTVGTMAFRAGQRSEPPPHKTPAQSERPAPPPECPGRPGPAADPRD